MRRVSESVRAREGWAFRCRYQKQKYAQKSVRAPFFLFPSFVLKFVFPTKVPTALRTALRLYRSCRISTPSLALSSYFPNPLGLQSGPRQRPYDHLSCTRAPTARRSMCFSAPSFALTMLDPLGSRSLAPHLRERHINDDPYRYRPRDPYP